MEQDSGEQRGQTDSSNADRLATQPVGSPMYASSTRTARIAGSGNSLEELPYSASIRALHSITSVDSGRSARCSTRPTPTGCGGAGRQGAFRALRRNDAAGRHAPADVGLQVVDRDPRRRARRPGRHRSGRGTSPTTSQRCAARRGRAARCSTCSTCAPARASTRRTTAIPTATAADRRGLRLRPARRTDLPANTYDWMASIVNARTTAGRSSTDRSSPTVLAWGTRRRPGRPSPTCSPG